jgi:hypothetical protein
MPSWETLEDFARQGVQKLIQGILEEEAPRTVLANVSPYLLKSRRLERMSF